MPLVVFKRSLYDDHRFSLVDTWIRSYPSDHIRFDPPLFIAGKYIAYDPDFVQYAELPDVDAMAREGWELTYSAEDNDYHMLAQVYSTSGSSRYRVILCDTNYTGGVREDMECDSYLEAKELAEE